MQKNNLVLLCVLLAAAIEGVLAWPLFAGVEPFPYNEFYFRIFDHLLRDCLLGWAVWGLYFRRSRIKDRVRRYFPVVVVGVMYLQRLYL